MKITDIFAREIYDSRGIPTLECELILDDEISIYSSVPTGLSKSSYESYDLRDGGSRLMGLGVKKAIATIEEKISPQLIGLEPNIVNIDELLINLDDTDDKSNLGANSILAVSIAACRAQAVNESTAVYELIANLCDFETVSLPNPLFNVINGGLHADNNLGVQEILIMPVGALSFDNVMEIGVTIFHKLKDLLKENGLITAVGEEGGFAPNFDDFNQALDFLMEAIEFSGATKHIVIGLDIAASHLYNTQKNTYSWQGYDLSAMDLINCYKKIISQYPIYIIEDGLAESDWHNWKIMNQEIGSSVKLIGDDIFATNPQRIYDGIKDNIVSGAVIKPNQIGTITETLQAVILCKENDLDVIVSHRSGETNDFFIADLAVGISADFIKAGGCSRGERIIKYNRLLAIENELISAD